MGTLALRPAPRLALLASALVLAAIISYQAARFWLAFTWVQTGDPAQMQRGANLVPGNADTWDRLGRYYLLSFADPDVPQAVTDFQRAVQVNPLSEDYWMDLGSAEDAAGDVAAARAAYQQAISVYPTSAVAAWNYGNFLLRQGDDAGALDEIQRAVRGNPQLLTLAVSRVWRSSGDVNELLQRVIPADTDSYLRSIGFFGTIHQIPPAMAIWNKVVEQRQSFDLPRIFDFIEEMIRDDDGADARKMWNEAVSLNGVQQLSSADDSLVSDGSFRAAFPDGGLGWRWINTPGAAVDFDSSTPKGQGRSIRVDFSGGVNLNLTSPQQYVAVEPGRTYRFHAALRTLQVSTESGVHVNVTDPNHSGVLHLQSDNFIGSHSWTDIDFEVKADPATHFVLIQLMREPSRMFENQLSGTAWLSDISLTPEAPKTTVPQP